ncbi:MAG TPA: Mur ligase family protein [Acidimicrobiia bacterium]|nr:Mur ligase family protein [Acidimicrobiia bacterium]
MNIGAARAWLDAHVNLESTGLPPGADRRATAPTLARIEALVALLGSPQESYPVIHLTGTNGKTSVARMTSALLEAEGLSVGTYTSPHLEDVSERIVWNGEPVADVTFADLLSRVADVEDHLPDRPSYFEILTAAALTWFSDVAVDVAVVEVGVGGTWDATNVVDGRVAVITNVSVDHVEYLGPTRELIAADKAGIIEPGSTLVLGETDPALAGYFLDRGAARVLKRAADFGVRGNRLAHAGRLVDLFTPDAAYDGVYLPLHGAYQADNAAAALAAADSFLERPLPENVVTDAFASVRSPGRLEVLGHQPLVLLDGAHNVAGAETLRAALTDEFPETPRTLIIGLLREKEPHEMLEALDAKHAARLLCCRPPSPRALDPGLVAAAGADLGVDPTRIETFDSVEAAVARARAVTDDDAQIVVTGSLYTVGAARHALVHPSET